MVESVISLNVEGLVGRPEDEEDRRKKLFLSLKLKFHVTVLYKFKIVAIASFYIIS